jgi:hypothetical protein
MDPGREGAVLRVMIARRAVRHCKIARVGSPLVQAAQSMLDEDSLRG